MGLHSRDDRQMQAVPGLSPAQCDPLLSVFSDVDQTTQPQTYAEGGAAGTRRRTPGGGSNGQLPTMAETVPLVLSYDPTSPPCDVLGTPCAMARATAHDQLHTFASMLDDTVVHLDLLPSRELTTPEALHAALQGGARLLIDATARAAQRSQEDAKQREHSRGKTTASVAKHGQVAPEHVARFSGADVAWAHSR